MALLPSRQFCPSSFHGTRFNLFACDSSLPRKELSLYVMSFGIAASSSSGKCLGRKSSYSPVGTGKSISLLCCSVNFSTGNNWLDKWNEPKKQNKPKMPQAVMDYRNNGNAGTGGSTMQRIVEKLKKFGYMDDEDVGRRESSPERVIEKGSVEDIFYVEEGLLPNAHGGFAAESSFGEGNLFGDNGEVKFPWEKIEEKRDEQKWSARSKSKTSLAELTLPESELRRLRHLTFKTKSKMRIGGGGITQAVVDTIHERWKASEIVRLKIEGSNALNMKRTHEILERKTGGLVIWRSGTSVSLYRGVSYENPSVQLNKRMYRKDGSSVSSSTTLADSTVCSDLQYDVSEGKQASDIGLENNDAKSMHEIEYEDEMDKWLDSLGPRYEDWQGIDPLPVDADMLPGVVHNYRPPLRILPYGVRATLSQKEATALRRLARVLPPHFALGRSRQLQGLAVAMIKLWEKSSIAKIALKRGVQLTTSERMAEDMKKLTGGVLLSRNKDYLVFYRGKNFLSAEVTEALLERERLAKSLQDEEEQARLRASALVVPTDDLNEQPGDTGTLGETLDANTKWGKKLDQLHKEKVMMEAERTRHAVLVRKLEGKLAFAERKLMRAERALSKVEESLKPSERQADPESISDEERFMFRKLGLRMKAFLLLGRRGVFDGTVENMHLHWKYRELVKIIVKAKTFDHVRKIALALEAESGGVLVSVDKVSKGYAIVVFRGKDYKRPSNLRPKNLLTKRKALARSIELQRLEALEKHVTNMQTKVEKLRDELKHMDSIKDKGDEAFYYRMDSAYPTDEEESEDEGDGSYLETNDSGNNGAKNDSPSYELLSDEDFANDEDEQNESERGQEYPAGHEYAVPGAVCSIDQGEKIHS